MFKPNAISLALLVAAGSVVMPAQAQSDEAGAKENVESIQVTGSRIRRTDMETPVPVAIISREDIEKTGSLNIADVLKQSPVTVASLNSSSTTFGTQTVGLNTTSLRNLGSSRTLVLVNGRRYVSGMSPSIGYAVDLNSIPTSMIERVEILKSASSAVYGSDAVAGVVNIILRDDFEGAELDVQAGISQEGDSSKTTASLTLGTNFDKGNMWLSLGTDRSGGLKASDRDFSKYDLAVLLDENGDEYIDKVFSSYPPQGRVGGYNGDGTVYDGSENSFNRGSYRQLVTPLTRSYAAGGASYDVNNDATVFAEFQWITTGTDGSTIEPTPMDMNDIFLKNRGGKGGLDVMSPLLPDLLRDNLLADGITNLNQTTFVRRLVEFGARSTDLTRDTARLALGADWNLNDNWVANTYLTWGQTAQHQENGGQLNLERARYALDVEVASDGSLRCVDDLARMRGCVPFDVFGAGSITPEAVEYLSVPAKSYGKAEQLVLSQTITGELPLMLSGGAMAMAAGVEYRKEKGQYASGEFSQVGATTGNASEPTKGEFDTTDVFVEFSLPLMDNFTMDLAGRYADHSEIGGTFTWNAGVEYRPIDDLMLRASAAKAVRTPNISDLYSGRGETFTTVADPCNGVTATTTGNAAENCRSIAGIMQRINENGEFTLSQTEAQGTGGSTGGNPNVQEETANTYSFGAVWQATDNLSATVDYYDIEVDDAIATTSRTVVLQRCFSASPADFDPTCGGQSIRNDEGVLLEVHSGTSNENILRVNGVDMDLSYNLDMGDRGDLRATVQWTHILDMEQEGIVDGNVANYRGQVDNPKNRFTANFSWRLEDVSLSWTARHWGSAVDSTTGSNYNFTNFSPLAAYNQIGSVTYHDLSGKWYVDPQMTVRFGINNLLDRQPPLLPQGTSNGSTGINTYPAAYDVVGRFAYVGMKYNF